MTSAKGELKTFGEHLSDLRKVLVRVVCVVAVCMIVVFCFKEEVFDFLLGPCQSEFATFRFIRRIISWGYSAGFSLYPNNIELIATDISSQFMAHVSLSFYIGIMLASPYIIYEMMRYVTPALYEKERKYALRLLLGIYLLFFLGMLVSYWLLFPISCRFLASYSVSAEIRTMITLDSYISLFVSLTVLMGIVFQLPVIALTLGKMGLIDHKMMAHYRRHSFILIVVVAAIITPPDVLTLIIVSLPLYFLYEVSILGVRITGKKNI